MLCLHLGSLHTMDMSLFSRREHSLSINQHTALCVARAPERNFIKPVHILHIGKFKQQSPPKTITQQKSLQWCLGKQIQIRSVTTHNCSYVKSSFPIELNANAIIAFRPSQIKFDFSITLLYSNIVVT